MGNQKGDGSQQHQKQNNYSSEVYAITLTDSVFFPEGGGQPADRGILHIQDPSRDAPPLELHVSDAQNIDEICVIFCRALSGTSSDQISSLLSESSRGDS